ncbi:MAG TPA: MFS transporter [Puia sp.]|nr:MFS transporter [Puia sp.]
MPSIQSPASPAKELRRIIAAASVGTVIEWYDFYIFGSLAPILATQFFPASNPTAALLFTLATFAAGLIVRPFGALVFGRLGDLSGRKHSFLITLTIMGFSTFAIGLVPGYATIGFVAPLIVVLLRLLQGLALGGEYGGAAIYIAEHCAPDRRGRYTSLIQGTASVGLLISLGVILITRYALDPDHSISIEKFNAWGWRVPFLLSIVLVVISLYIRLKMQESPMFVRLKTEGKLSGAPLTESFTRRANLKMVLVVLFGMTMGSGVVFYTGQFYVQTFMENVCRIDFDQTRTMLLIAIVFAAPFFMIFGAWSDRIGRKWILLGGMLLSAVTWPFLFGEMQAVSGTAGRKLLAGKTEIQNTVSFIGKTRDMLRTSATVSYYADGMRVTDEKKDTVYADGHTSREPVMSSSRQLPPSDYWTIVAVLFAITLFVAMACGPIAAFLVELFPTRIRYSAMSLPYHLGNGIFGGLAPFLAALLTATHPGARLPGLWYPVGITLCCVLVGAWLIPGRKQAFHQVGLEDI